MSTITTSAEQWVGLQRECALWKRRAKYLERIHQEMLAVLRANGLDSAADTLEMRVEGDAS